MALGRTRSHPTDDISKSALSPAKRLLALRVFLPLQSHIANMSAYNGNVAE